MVDNGLQVSCDLTCVIYTRIIRGSSIQKGFTLVVLCRMSLRQLKLGEYDYDLLWQNVGHNVPEATTYTVQGIE